MESAQKSLAQAIEAGDAAAQVEANKRIAELAFENAKIQQRQVVQEEKPAQLSDGGKLPKEHHNHYLKLILWLKIGLLETNGLELTEL